MNQNNTELNVSTVHTIKILLYSYLSNGQTARNPDVCPKIDLWTSLFSMIKIRRYFNHYVTIKFVRHKRRKINVKSVYIIVSHESCAVMMLRLPTVAVVDR